jgi:alkylation response protein AidB-like acyl-CoA dehydrogenase
MLILLHAGTAIYIQSLSGGSLEGICSNAQGAYAKGFCTNAALDISIDSVQIHGGYGYMQDYGVEKLMRDAKLLHLLGGQNPVLQIDAARRELGNFRPPE